MNKRYQLSILIPLLILMISGCSAVTDLSNSINYATEATKYINQMNTYTNDVPALFQKAVTDKTAATELEQKLNAMKKDIQNFNQLNPPDFAQDIHQNIETKNQAILQAVDLYLNNIKNGQITPEMVKDLEIFQSIQDLNGLLNQLEQLQQ